MTDRTSPETERAVSWRTWVGFSLLCLGMFMAILDIQVVATSLPTIQRALGIAPDRMSWIQTAYLIAEVIAIPLTGFATRVLSMRWLFVLAVGLFTFASAGCASAGSFEALIAWRVLQGFSGGALIPLVFTAALVLFPFRWQGLATTIGGVLAVLAPTVGPIVGGWITQTYSWHWLFLINVLPGIACALFTPLVLPRDPLRLFEARHLDLFALVVMAVGLAALEIGLKDAPHYGWLSVRVIALLAIATLAALVFVWRSLVARNPFVELRTLADPAFAVGCVLSFLFGVGIFGSTYLMPVFLGLVRDHGPLRIGEIMLVTGIAQLLTAPVAVALERRVDARVMAVFGFALFALGLGMSAVQTRDTDFAGMFWPQVVRGVSVMFCLLPATRLALGALPPEKVPDASGLFNLMRNLGGAIGLALIDTVIFGRAPKHADAIVARLEAGDYDTAALVGIPPELFAWRPAGPLPEDMKAQYAPFVEKLALTSAINEAWILIAVLTAAAIVALPLTRAVSRAGQGAPLH